MNIDQSGPSLAGILRSALPAQRGAQLHDALQTYKYHPEDYERAMVMSAQNNFVECFHLLLPYCVSGYAMALLWAAPKGYREIALALLPYCTPDQIQNVTTKSTPSPAGMQLLQEIKAMIDHKALEEAIKPVRDAAPDHRTTRKM